MGRRRRTGVGTGLEPPRWARAVAARPQSSALPQLPEKAALGPARSALPFPFPRWENGGVCCGPIAPSPTPSPGTCWCPGAVPGRTSGLETHHERKVQTSCLEETGSHAQHTLPETPVKTGPSGLRPQLLVSRRVVLWPERSFSPLKGGRDTPNPLSPQLSPTPKAVVRIGR